ncbi:MAG: EF-hand domain-containing protein [Halieaceae bacterium]|nr:EF-hand domain-containing protein [Halieaceae bacterium]
MNQTKLSFCFLIASLCVSAAAAQFAEAGKPHGKHPPIDLNELRTRTSERFAAADADSNGKLSPAEFSAYHGAKTKAGGRSHKNCGGKGAGKGWRKFRGGSDDSVSRQQLRDQIFDEADLDGNGELSRKEASGMKKAARSVRKRALFAKLDKDKDGMLSEQEFSARVARLNALDANSDGQLSGEEIPRGKWRR